MPVFLSDIQQQEVFDRIKRSFCDIPSFDTVVARQLKKLIADSVQLDIDAKLTRKLTDRYFDKSLFQTAAQKAMWKDLKVLVTATYVLILSYDKNNVNSYFWRETSALLEAYPSFSVNSAVELKFLLNFRNYLRLALLVVPAEHNKLFLLAVASRLEGSNQVYITGGGQKMSVTHRVQIYEREGEISARPCPKRQIAYFTSAGLPLPGVGSEGSMSHSEDEEGSCGRKRSSEASSVSATMKRTKVDFTSKPSMPTFAPVLPSIPSHLLTVPAHSKAAFTPVPAAPAAKSLNLNLTNSPVTVAATHSPVACGVSHVMNFESSPPLSLPSYLPMVRLTSQDSQSSDMSALTTTTVASQSTISQGGMECSSGGSEEEDDELDVDLLDSILSSSESDSDVDCSSSYHHHAVAVQPMAYPAMPVAYAQQPLPYDVHYKYLIDRLPQPPTTYLSSFPYAGTASYYPATTAMYMTQEAMVMNTLPTMSSMSAMMMTTGGGAVEGLLSNDEELLEALLEM